MPEKFAKDVLCSGLSKSLDKTDEDRSLLIRFMGSLRKENAVSSVAVQESFKALCNMLDQHENEITQVLDAVSLLLSEAVNEKLLSLSEVASYTDNGLHHPLFLLVLQQLHKKRGKTVLSEMFNSSKVRTT